MDVSIKVQYSSEEVGKMVINEHGCKFGQAPVGYKWAAYDHYGSCRVVAEKIEEEPYIPPAKPEEVEVIDPDFNFADKL